MVILTAVFAPLPYRDYRKTDRIHQHEQEIPQEPCTDPKDGGLCTYLPIDPRDAQKETGKV